MVRVPSPAGQICAALIAVLAVGGSSLHAEAPSGAGSGAGADSVAAEIERMSRIGRCGSPSFSPDGARLAVVCDLSGVPQVWTVPAEGGFPRMVTAFDDQVGGVAWSPDGEWLAISLAPGGGMNQQVYLARPDGTDLHRITDGGDEGNWLQGWRDDGGAVVLSSNREDRRSMDAYLYEMDGGVLRKVYDLDGIGGLTDLSPDGARGVLYQMVNRGDDDVSVLDLESGESHLLTPHEGTATSGPAHLGPDGRTVHLVTDVGRDLHALARVRIGEDGTPGELEIVRARDDADLASLLVSDDGRIAVLGWNAAGRTELEILDLETGEVTARPEPPAEIARPAELSADGRRLALVVSGSTQPTDVWVYELGSGAFTRVTESPHPGVDLSTLVAPELVRYEAHDGLELSGWLYRPAGREGSGPYVLSFHGGPEGQERPGFRSDYQALLARGIGVFAPNVRGSSGFGKRFVHLDDGELRFDAIRDIESSVRFLVSEGVADPERIGIMGGSYGGYMTLAGLAWYPELFAAGVDLFGMVHFATFFEHTEPWMAAISTVEYGDPETEADLLWELSPLSRIEKITAPTLVLHGANDTNVPLVEAEQVAEKLEQRGVPVELVVFPDEGHGFRKTENRIRATVETVEWLERYLVSGGPEGEATTSRSLSSREVSPRSNKASRRPRSDASDAGSRRMAITIDDLPVAPPNRHTFEQQEEVTERLLAVLDAHDAPAVGFVNERKLAVDGEVDPRRVALLERWLDAGHELGNHGHSHLDLHRVEPEAWMEDVLRGERVIRPLLAGRSGELRWFRHPFLHAGRSAEIQRRTVRFLDEHGYRVAPVTIDNGEWIYADAYADAWNRNDEAAMERLGRDYVRYMLDVVDYYESQSREIVGELIPQSLLIHAYALNADRVDRLLTELEERGYEWVTLEEALEHPAYDRPALGHDDGYTGPGGITWLHRWAIAEGRDPAIFRGEPEVPEWVRKLSESGYSGAPGGPKASAASEPLVVDRARVHPLTSKINGVAYELRVSVPHGYQASGRRYPVVYTLDADYSFLLARNITDHLAERDHLDEVIVVSIGYRDQEPGRTPTYRRNRTRDYTPTFVADAGYGPEYQKLSGGAPEFLDVIEREIVPFVGQTYRTVRGDRTLVGHSYGGLFTVWTLLTGPGLFDGYVAVSPSLWYDDHLIRRLEEAYARDHDALPGRLYLCVGSREGNARIDMVGDLEELADTFERRSYAGLSFDSRVMEDETHNSIFPGCLSNGLRFALEGR